MPISLHPDEFSIYPGHGCLLGRVTIPQNPGANAIGIEIPTCLLRKPPSPHPATGRAMRDAMRHKIDPVILSAITRIKSRSPALGYHF